MATCIYVNHVPAIVVVIARVSVYKRLIGYIISPAAAGPLIIN